MGTRAKFPRGEPDAHNGCWIYDRSSMTSCLSPQLILIFHDIMTTRRGHWRQLVRYFLWHSQVEVSLADYDYYSPCTVHQCPATGNSSATRRAPCSRRHPRFDSLGATAVSSSWPPCCRGCGTPFHRRLRTQEEWSSSTALCHAEGPRTSSVLPHACCLICVEDIDSVSHYAIFLIWWTDHRKLC